MLRWIEKYFNTKKIDDIALTELEEALIAGDVGVRASEKIVADFSKNYKDQNINIKTALAEDIIQILETNVGKIAITNKPHIIMLVGVNGSGKTTALAKLANMYKNQGKQVSIIAADTFRAAAVEQIQSWGEKSQIKVFVGGHNSDPAALCYDGLKEAILEQDDIVLIDTAGRLQNKTNLMEELKKIISVIKKIDASAPHTKILTIDATTGQNALGQIKTFDQFVGVSGLIVNKFDGTAKAGIIVAICQEFDFPIYYMGVGESLEDLQEFNPEDFVEKLLRL